MNAGEAVELLKKMESIGGQGVVNDDLMVIYTARIGWNNQRIRVSTINDVPDVGDTPHTIVIPGLLNPVEQDYIINILNADANLMHRHITFVNRLISKSP
ncbi:hypothetical protein [Vulcanisaeta sp. JCM 14467]|uniref:hypothetical protein n=1 Tax=Vulcanisaeta sp. JCM 14467 TaxID=1295370 RepID=UPI000A9A83C3|nr:hypothetical protein [Vulcanisaeta sp. JCM 14467]